MALNWKQKRFIRKNHAGMSVKKMARKLQLRPKDVRRALRELGLDDKEFEKSDAKVQKQSPARERASRLMARLEVLKNYKIALPLVVGLALLLRLIHIIDISDTPFFLHLHTDPWMYDHWAKEIIAGDWAGRARPVFYLAPAYPYFLAVIYSIFGPSNLAACIIQAILSAASAGLIYHLARCLFGPVTGLIAGLAAALYAMFIFYSGLLLGATMIIFLDLMLLVLLVSAMQRPRVYKWLLAGVFLGLSACARGNVLLFGPLAVVSIAAWFGFKLYRKWLLPCALFTLATVITISPVTLHNLLVGDDPVLLTSNAGANFYIGNNRHSGGIYMKNARYNSRPLGLSVRDQQANFPSVAKRESGDDELEPSEVSSFWVSKTLEEIGADFGGWLDLIGTKFLYFINAYEVPNNRNIYFSRRFSGVLHLPLVTIGLLMPLGLLGLIISIRGFKRRGILAAFFAAHLLALLAFFVNARYRLVVMPVLTVYAAAMLRWLSVKIRKRELARAALAGGGVLLAGLLVFRSVPEINYRANYLNLANAYRDLDQPEKAIENYDWALEISPGFYYAIFKKGQVQARLGRKAQARESLRRALGLARHNKDLLNVRRIEAELGRLGTPGSGSAQP